MEFGSKGGFPYLSCLPSTHDQNHYHNFSFSSLPVNVSPFEPTPPNKNFSSHPIFNHPLNSEPSLFLVNPPNQNSFDNSLFGSSSYPCIDPIEAFLMNQNMGNLHSANNNLVSEFLATETWDQPRQRFELEPTTQRQNFPPLMSFKENGSSPGGGTEKVEKAEQVFNRKTQSEKSLKAIKKSNLIKGQWSVDEDRQLEQLVAQHGVKHWSAIANLMKGRLGKQCRERWHNHLKPDIKKDQWSEEEDVILIDAHQKMGNKWTEIAKKLPGRSENTVKNHWNATKRKQECPTRGGRKECNQKPSLLRSYINSVSVSTSANNN